MKKKDPGVLGVAISDGAIEAVLLRRDDKQVALVKRFVKQRVRTGDRISDLAAVIPGLKDSADSDYTMEIGDGSRGPSSGVFLASEFADARTAVADKAGSADATARRTSPFGLQLKEILTECQKLGFADPVMAFSVGSSEVTYTEVSLPASKQSVKATGAPASTALTASDTKQLLARLKEMKIAGVDKNRIGFVRLGSLDNRRRFLAVIPETPDPVVSALKVVARRGSSKSTAAVVDSEVSLLHSMARRDVLNRKGTVAIIRVGAEDTLIIFSRDGVLDRHERLRSLTSYDPVETICSRVLLKQDEWKIDAIDRVYISSDYHSTAGMDEYASYFVGAETMPIVELLGSVHIKLPAEENNKIRSSALPAVAVAMRVLEDWDKDDKSAINLMSGKLKKELAAPKVSYSWHSFVLLALLFGVALFYTWKYMQGEEEISLKEEQIRLNPPQFPTESAALLRQRVDSLNNEYTRLTRALVVLDSLLIGSDRWSNALDAMSDATNDISRIWLKGWTPSGSMVRVEGNALARNRVAALAQRWNGSIEKLNFADIQGIRVYSFIMMVPVPSELPKVAEYLRNESIDSMEPDVVPQLVTLREIAKE